ncbi:MAG: class A beta-lactamase-related serine hydrolase, partial [Myxococcales bacterium]
MSDPWPRQLDDVARLVVDEIGASPAAVVAASAGFGGYWRRAIGAHGSLWPGGPAAAPTSVFDLASVTKSFVALSAARLNRQRPELWTTPLGRLLAEARGTPSESITLDLLLAHRAGLDAHRPLYAPLVEGTPVARAGALREAASARRADCPGDPPAEGFAPLYSDLGYLLAGAALERASGRRLGELVAHEVV